MTLMLNCIQVYPVLKINFLPLEEYIGFPRKIQFGSVLSHMSRMNMEKRRHINMYECRLSAEENGDLTVVLGAAEIFFSSLTLIHSLKTYRDKNLIEEDEHLIL